MFGASFHKAHSNIRRALAIIGVSIRICLVVAAEGSTTYLGCGGTIRRVKLEHQLQQIHDALVGVHERAGQRHPRLVLHVGKEAPRLLVSHLGARRIPKAARLACPGPRPIDSEVVAQFF